MRVLIVEDDAVTRELLATFTGGLGHDVQCCENGLEALVAFESEPTPIVLTDWSMPKMSGIELCRRIRASKALFYPYILVMTANDKGSGLLEALEEGADDFMRKPIDFPELGARLKIGERIYHAQTRIQELDSVISLCSYCHNVKHRDKGWLPLMNYVEAVAGATFSHGMCDSCYDHHIRPFVEKGRNKS